VIVKHDCPGINDAATATASAGREARENALGMQPLFGSFCLSESEERATNSGNLPGLSCLFFTSCIQAALIEWGYNLSPVYGGICRAASLSYPRDAARQRRELDPADELVRSRLNSHDISHLNNQALVLRKSQGFS
jgi:hypothetical protein